MTAFFVGVFFCSFRFLSVRLKSDLICTLGCVCVHACMFVFSLLQCECFQSEGSGVILPQSYVSPVHCYNAMFILFGVRFMYGITDIHEDGASLCILL